MWVKFRSHLLRQCETWVWFWRQLQNGYANHKLAKTPPIISTTPGSHEYDYTCIYYKPDWLLQQFDEWTASEYHQETLAYTKHSCQIGFQSDEIFPHNSCTRYASLASNQIPDLIQNTIGRLQRTSWQGAYLHPRNDHPSKSKRYSIRSNEERVLKVPKFMHDTFGERACAVYGPLAWDCLPKEIRFCNGIEAFKRNRKTHLFVKFVNDSTLAIWFWGIIVKLFAQFVALYKPGKPKPLVSTVDRYF